VHTPLEIEISDFQEHPAVRAWEKISPGEFTPVGVVLLKKKNDWSVVFRIQGVGRGGHAVIAKRCILATGLVERTIYADILPQLGISAPDYYGFVKEDEKFCWIFLQDVSAKRFSPLIEEHQLIAARWLGKMHAIASKILSSGFLPDRGANHYLTHLRTARATILENFTNRALTDEDKIILKKVLSQLTYLESGWEQIEQFCSEIPSTLVHGDFRPKNVYVRDGQDGLVLFPLDWELAGWGVPAPDLATARGLPSFHQINLHEYWSIVSEDWPGLDLHTIERLARVGHVFRRLAAIGWASLGLAYEWPEKDIGRMNQYQAELAATLQTAPWTA